MVWYGVVWCGMVWYGVVWCGMVWYGVVWCNIVWYGMVWYGMVWYGVVWYASDEEWVKESACTHADSLVASWPTSLVSNQPISCRRMLLKRWFLILKVCRYDTVNQHAICT